MCHVYIILEKKKKEKNKPWLGRFRNKKQIHVLNPSTDPSINIFYIFLFTRYMATSNSNIQRNIDISTFFVIHFLSSSELLIWAGSIWIILVI